MTDSQDKAELDSTGKDGLQEKNQPGNYSEALTSTPAAPISPDDAPAPSTTEGDDAPVATTPAHDSAPKEDPELKKRTRRALLKYGAMRLVLFLVLTVVIQVIAMLVKAPVPLVMSALLALIIAFPLSMLIFTSLREEATAGVALVAKQRKEHKEWIRNELAKR